MARAGSRKTKPKPPAGGDQHVAIRMYDVGFGDAFLLTIPTPDGPRKVLFDCGSIKAASRPIGDIVRRIVDDVKDADGVPRIDVVVATHRHRDHVAGFESALWKDVEVREVWMPWTEDPKDPTARRIRETQSSLALSLDTAFQRQASGGGAGAPAAVAGWGDLALNALTNDKAMATLHSGFRGDARRRFLPTKPPDEQTIKTDALPGVLVHVMGPSRSESVIRDMDPPAGQSYLRLVDSTSLAVSAPDPFDEDWWMPLGDASVAHLPLSDDDRKTVEAVGQGFEPLVAVALDKAVNGTSLMLMLQIGEVYLLCPGDAQWGTWEAALGNPEWRALMRRTVFYKIGHHGSHNATPVDFVEHVVGRDFWAMASTTHVDQWPNIPRAPLLEALGQRTTKIARTDRPQDAPAPVFHVEPGLYIETRIPL
jgi:beta-lactamase superfamily II metal-dependent hydrolase